MLNPPCNVCGKPATCIVIDLQEAEPKRGPEGRVTPTYRVVQRVALCRAHKRPPIVIGLKEAD